MWSSKVRHQNVVCVNTLNNITNNIFRASMMNAVESAVKRANELTSNIK